MDQIYPDSTLLPILTKVCGSTGLDYHLYTNNLTPLLTTVLGDFTEAAWAGYVAQTVVDADFTIKAVVSHLGSFLAAPVAFANTSGAPVNAYGYFVTDNTTGDFVTCARFDSAPVTIPDGESRQVIPILANYSGLAS